MAQPRRPMPVLDFDHNEYAARVSVARLPTYSEPYPNGVPLPDRHYGGGRRIVLVQGWRRMGTTCRRGPRLTSGSWCGH